ncbi:TatD family deoxyribonuclease [bacterium]|nr:MAG: TatD family deoxyribonuclease [bacterium]
MIDSHAHLDHELFDPDRDEVIQRAFENGIKKIITVGCDLNEMKEAIKLAEKYDNIYAAIGLHPDEADKCMGNSPASNRQSSRGGRIARVVGELKKLAKYPKVVAIGEIGLDYFRSDNPPSSADYGVARQKELFIVQLKLAQELNLPVIIHCRASDNKPGDAYDDLLLSLREVMTEEERRGNLKKFQGVIHCFCGTREHAKQFLDLGFHISFTGNITYFKKDDAELLQVVREIPLNRILVETDCPFLTPVPHRGKRNEPMFVKYVAEKIANVKKISVGEVERVTDGNAERLFHFNI